MQNVNGRNLATIGQQTWTPALNLHSVAQPSVPSLNPNLEIVAYKLN